MKYSQAIIVAALASAAVVSAAQPRPAAARKGAPAPKHRAARAQGHFHTAKSHGKAPAASKSKGLARIAKGARKVVGAAIKAAGGHENAAMSAAAVYNLYKNRKSQGGGGGYDEYQRRSFAPKAVSRNRIHHRIGGEAAEVITPNHDTTLDHPTQGTQQLQHRDFDDLEDFDARDLDDLEHLDARDLDELAELVARGRLGDAFSKILHAANNAANVDPQGQPEQRDFDDFDELEMRDFEFELDELD